MPTRSSNRKANPSEPTPFVEYQWERVLQWRRRFANPPPALIGLEALWQAQSGNFQFLSGTAQRSEMLPRSGECAIGNNVMEAFFLFISMGMYPPPELMMTLHDCYTDYIRADGAVSLEEAFFGRPRQKAGIFSKREATARRNAYWAAELFLMKRDGFSEERAAAFLIAKLRVDIKSEAFLKAARPWLKRFDADGFGKYVDNFEAQPEEAKVRSEMFKWIASPLANGRLRNPQRPEVSQLAAVRGFIEPSEKAWRLTTDGKKALRALDDRTHMSTNVPPRPSKPGKPLPADTKRPVKK